MRYKMLSILLVFILLSIPFVKDINIIKAIDNNSTITQQTKENKPPKKLKLSEDKKILGVCSGIAEYFNIDPAFIRVIWGLLAICYGVGIIAYFIFYFVMF
ncbi:TPA: PspC domain-containing protein [Clostridium botulinum]|uniref:PspC domain-containing protein n=1 Tax=Clostridium botulinum TaxID=1491 RepID=UPI000463ABCE|nr:pspC domain protein [Clostridium botulinum]APQ71364.1 pspC domain protein [Clostridium botulinum]APR02575.1 pspC domain protein [Clostridium botulinum]